MTEGTPWRRIAEFAIPMLLGNLAQQLYNTVDSIVVGKYVGDNALAAVGTSMPILNLLLAVFVGVATGAGIVISQHFGAKNRLALSRAIGNCITLAAIASVATMILGTLITRPLLRLLDTPSSVFDWCADYLIIFFLGAAGFTFYNILSGILRGLGDSFSALGFLLVSTVLNIVLDIWFVAGLGLGVPGVSLATIIAQAVSAALIIITLLRTNECIHLELRDLREAPVDIWATADADTLEGTYFRILREMMENADDDDKERIRLAAEISRKILLGREVTL